MMKPHDHLRQHLQRLDGQDYTAYQSLKGAWSFPDFDLHIDRIPKDPYAPPSAGVYRTRVPRSKAAFPGAMTDSRIREIALRDFLARRIHQNCLAICKGRRGTGNGGIITIAEPGQVFLERTSVVVGDDFIEARVSLALPAESRAIDAATAAVMLLEELPRIVQTSLFAESLPLEALRRHLEVAEDSAYLRDSLAARGLVAFIAEGAVLPRASGVDPAPLESPNLVRFRSPPSLRVEFELPHAGTLGGMGIPRGVTLIVGGGYHGKSTLLQALQQGIYDHIPGDGREYCVSLPQTVKVRATNGRSVVRTDISAFITDIPLGGDTRDFSTANASGSTSQAAFIAEAIEAGAGVLLMDEDTSATNFMIRDRRMQELVAKQHEPITAYVDKVRQLYEEHGISTLLVMGGSGDYFGAADCVIRMTEFEPDDATESAHEIASRLTTDRAREGTPAFSPPRPRIPLPDGLDPHNDYGRLRITATSPWQLVFGRQTVDLSDVEQIVETAQTRAIGRAILHAKGYMDGKRDLRHVAEQVMEDIRREGLDVLDPALTGDLAQFRALEFTAALNRMRSLTVIQ